MDEKFIKENIFGIHRLANQINDNLIEIIIRLGKISNRLPNKKSREEINDLQSLFLHTGRANDAIESQVNTMLRVLFDDVAIEPEDTKIAQNIMFLLPGMNGGCTRELIKRASTNTSRREVQRVLKKYQGVLWSYQRGARNMKKYFLLSNSIRPSQSH